MGLSFAILELTSTELGAVTFPCIRGFLDFSYSPLRGEEYWQIVCIALVFRSGADIESEIGWFSVWSVSEIFSDSWKLWMLDVAEGE
jgi:hypothetical protein